MKKILALILLMWSVGSTVQAEEVTLTSDADTYLRSGNYGPYGSTDTMRIYGGGFPGYIRFDLSSLGTVEISDASFTVTRVSGGNIVAGRIQTIGLNNIEGNTPQDWDEATLTWNRSGYTVAGAELTAVPYTNAIAAGLVTNLDPDAGADVTESIASYAAVTITGNDLISFLQGRIFDGGLTTLIVCNPDGSEYYLASKENTTVAVPSLTLTYTPIRYAFLPTPEDGTTVNTEISELNFNIPDPNTAGGTVTCDVYFGTDPNSLPLVYSDVEDADLPLAFPGTPVTGTTYYWQVDTTDTTAGTTTGAMWSFLVSGAPEIAAQPAFGSDFVAGSVTLTTTFTSATALTVDPVWYKDGDTPVQMLNSDADVTTTVALDSETGIYTASMTIANLVAADEADYYCVMTNSSGSTQSDSAALIVKRLLAKYDFESNCNDSSDEGMNATGTDITYTSSISLLGNAADFNGTTSLITAPEGFSKFNAGITISVWANPSETANWARFIDFGNSTDVGDNNIMFTRSASTADLLVQFWDGATSSSFYATSAITDGQWQLLTASVDESGNIIVYKDGFEFASGTIDLPTNVVRTSNLIGDSNWTTDALYVGQMDDLRIYNYGISADEAALIYANGVGDYCRTQPTLDFSGNCIVDVLDLAYIADNWLECGLYPNCDK